MIYYFTPDYVEIIHNKIIEISGGRYGYSQSQENIEIKEVLSDFELIF